MKEKCDEKKKGKIFEVGMSWSLRDLCWSQLLQFGTINRSRGDRNESRNRQLSLEEKERTKSIKTKEPLLLQR